MRVVGYVRVSTDEQAASGVSLEAQASRVREYCSAHALELVELVADPGQSAKSLDRPGLARALGLLEAPDVAGLAVAKLDRLTRNVGDFAGLLEGVFSRRGDKRLFSASEPVGTRSASGRLGLFILIVVSQWELEVNHERTEGALAHKQTLGQRTGSVPYGWDLNEDGPRNSKGRPVDLVENPTEQAVILLIHELARLGHAPRGIARRLNLEGTPSKTGGPWHHSSVAKILGRKARGAIESNGQDTARAEPGPTLPQ